MVCSSLILKIFEEYFAGRHRYQAHAMHSVSKSVTSILVGIADDQGLIGVNDPVHSYFVDYHGLEWIDRPYPITIEYLPTMAHGTDWDERSRPLSDGDMDTSCFRGIDESTPYRVKTRLHLLAAIDFGMSGKHRQQRPVGTG